MNQLAATDARLPALQDATELRSRAETRREAAVAELRKEILQLQQDFAQRKSQDLQSFPIISRCF